MGGRIKGVLRKIGGKKKGGGDGGKALEFKMVKWGVGLAEEKGVEGRCQSIKKRQIFKVPYLMQKNLHKAPCEEGERSVYRSKIHEQRGGQRRDQFTKRGDSIGRKGQRAG